MKTTREVLITGDGSPTIAIPELNVTYHSRHGAVQESVHVFIAAGLHFAFDTIKAEPLHVLEMGLGTGLNALLTAVEAEKNKKQVHYTALELYPLNEDEWHHLAFDNKEKSKELLKQIHGNGWSEDVALHDGFTLRKEKADLLHYTTAQRFQLVYYDAFAPSAQPELWKKEVFEKLHGLMQESGLLVTYCSKGDVRRAMQAAGFMVEKLPGPKGKREMLRARRL